MNLFVFYFIIPINSFEQCTRNPLKLNNKKNKKRVLTHYQHNVSNQDNVFNQNKIRYHSIEYVSTLDIIASTYIICNALKKKIVVEVVNDSFMLQTFDNLQPLYVLILMISSTFSLNRKYDTKIERLQIKKPRNIYRWIDFSIIVMIIVLMRNVKNAI